MTTGAACATGTLDERRRCPEARHRPATRLARAVADAAAEPAFLVFAGMGGVIVGLDLPRLIRWVEDGAPEAPDPLVLRHLAREAQIGLMIGTRRAAQAAKRDGGGS